MKNENVITKPAKTLANISLKLGKISANSACAYIFHQPKIPKELKALKKNKYEILVGKNNDLCN